MLKINCHVDNSVDEERAEIWVRKMTPKLADLLEYLNNNEQVLWCNHDKELVPVHYRDIFSIQTANHVLEVTTANNQYIYRKPISILKDQLTDDFIAASRSAIFNFKHIDHLELMDNGAIDVILKNHQRIPISRRKMKNLKARLGL